MSQAVSEPVMVIDKQLNNLIVKRIFEKTLEYVSQNRNRTIIIEGDPGSGKSWTALTEKYILGSLKAGHPLKPNEFCWEDITFDPRRMLKRMNTVKEHVIIFDEGGVGANARKWYDAANIALSQAMQVVRYRRNILIVTVPRFEMIDKHLRLLVNERHFISSRMGNYNLVAIRYLSKRGKDPEPWITRPQLKIQLPTGKVVYVRVNGVYMPPPPKWLAEGYEKMAEEFKDRILEEALMTIDSVLGEMSEDDIDKLLDKVIYELASHPAELAKLTTQSKGRVKFTGGRLLKWGRVTIPKPIANDLAKQLNEIIFGDAKGMNAIEYMDAVLDGSLISKIKALGGVEVASKVALSK